jgi:hypothetical protein
LDDCDYKKRTTNTIGLAMNYFNELAGGKFPVSL